MNSAWNDILWHQMGTSMDMLENALHAAQLNLFLVQQACQSAHWVGRAKAEYATTLHNFPGYW